jgi:hypothetical protein
LGLLDLSCSHHDAFSVEKTKKWIHQRQLKRKQIACIKSAQIRRALSMRNRKMQRSFVRRYGFP